MKQAYSIDELWQIRTAALRPAVLGFLAMLLGILLATLTYQDTYEWATGPWMCLSGGLLFGGLFAWLVYGINYLAVARWTLEIERRHQMKWQMRGGRYSISSENLEKQ